MGSWLREKGESIASEKRDEEKGNKFKQLLGFVSSKHQHEQRKLTKPARPGPARSNFSTKL
jgi:hypothetical protein